MIRYGSGIQRTLVAVVAMLTAACGNAAPSVSTDSATSDETSAAATSSAPAEATEVQMLEPGRLDAGGTYEIPERGLSFSAEGDWLALLPSGGDVSLAGENGVSVYILRPETMLQADGSQAPLPEEPQAIADAVGALGITDVTAVTPFQSDSGVEGLQVDLEAQGGSESSPLVTTGTGAFGLADGPARWIIVPGDEGPVIFSIERADDPDIEASWEVAGPLLMSLSPAN